MIICKHRIIGTAIKTVMFGQIYTAVLLDHFEVHTTRMLECSFPVTILLLVIVLYSIAHFRA